MDQSIVSIIQDLGLQYPTFEKESFENEIISNQITVEYANFVSWISVLLQKFCGLEECVHPVENKIDDLNSFYLELKSFLRELECCYESLTSANLKEVLSDSDRRQLLLSYLANELRASVMVSAHQTIKKDVNVTNGSRQAESEIAANLRIMLSSLGFPKPPPDITPTQLFAKVIEKVKENLLKVSSKSCLLDPLFVGILSNTQWNTLKKINDSMILEYKTREDVLLKRLDVTVQSFAWSDRLKKFEDQLGEVYRSTKDNLKSRSAVQISDLLAARTDLLDLDKTSGVSVRSKTKSKINQVIVKGRVPDRGGRPSEIEPPPPEMPAWKQRIDGPPLAQRNFDRTGSHGGRGGRVQGSWNASGSTQNWDQHQGYGGGSGAAAYRNYDQQQPYSGQGQAPGVYSNANYPDYFGGVSRGQQDRRQNSNYDNSRRTGGGGGGRGSYYR